MAGWRIVGRVYLLKGRGRAVREPWECGGWWFRFFVVGLGRRRWCLWGYIHECREVAGRSQRCRSQSCPIVVASASGVQCGYGVWNRD